MNWAIELSKQHIPNSGQANLYGVIIYTDTHVHVKKVLKDEDYWEALDEISGPQWSVFATRAAQGYKELPDFPPGSFGFMVPVWKEPRTNKELLDVFELTSTEVLPAIVVFALNQNGEVYKRVLSINDSSQESAYDSIKEVLKTVAEALKDVDAEYLNNNVNAFQAVGYALHNYQFWRKIKKGLAIWQWLMSMK